MPVGALPAFAHLVAERAALYRAVLDVFVEARGRFQAYLRPADVLAALRAQGHPVERVDDLLDQLATWGNLSAHPDTAEVATIEEFYRTRFLFQLSREGEAVEAAVAAYVANLERTGELQAAALEDVLRFVRELTQLAGQEPVDSAQAFNVLRALQDRFGGLVEQARTFMAGVQRAVDLQGAELDALLQFKDSLIQYLERFIGQLVAVGAEVAAMLEALDPARVLALASAAARRELVDRLDVGPEATLAATDAWRGRIEGIRTWFLPSPGAPSQAAELRRRAREAIPALLAAVAAHHDRRTRRSDRVTDLRTLARWFADAETDAEAHRLWRAAFTLAPARHLEVDEASRTTWADAGVTAATPWAAAAPLVLSPRLRATGRHARAGRPDTIVDRSAERAILATRRAEDANRFALAEAVFATGEPRALSTLPVLDEVAFDLLLDLLADGVVGAGAEVLGSDGRFHVRVQAPADGAAARVVSERGTLIGLDYVLTVRRAAEVAA